MDNEKKTAVLCSSKDMWKRVQIKVLQKGSCWHDGNKYKNLWKERYIYCLTEYGVNGKIQCADESFWKNADYTIISAEDYLNTPKKIKPKVRCIGKLGMDFKNIIKRTKNNG